MESWIICGIIASVAWGVYILLVKIAVSKRYHNIHPSTAFGAISLAILGVALITLFVMRANISSFSLPGAAIALASGIIWGVGMFCVIRALSSPHTSVAKLTPLYNTNTLVATILGILVLKEIPHHIPEMMIGATLVVVGGVLVTRQTSLAGTPQQSLDSAAPKSKLGALKLESWIAYGIIASLAWGSYAVLLKVATGYYGCDPFVAFLAMSLGILIVSFSMFARDKRSIASLFKGASRIALASGVIWAIGIIAVIHALSNLHADVARLVPLYNTNTLIAVSLGMILLHEVSNRRLITILGAILIVIGGSIVAIV